MYIVTSTGEWVNEQFHRLAEIIQDYDSYLELRWVPPGQRDTDEEKKNPYCIIDLRSDYIVMFASERDNPEAILARLWGADNKHGNVLDRIEIDNAVKETFRLKERMDEEGTKREFVEFLIGTKKNYIDVRHPVTGERIKFDDQLRRR